jgi:hypothetical protein
MLQLFLCWSKLSLRAGTGSPLFLPPSAGRPAEDISMTERRAQGGRRARQSAQRQGEDRSRRTARANTGPAYQPGKQRAPRGHGIASHQTKRTQDSRAPATGDHAPPMKSDHPLNEHGTTRPNEPKRPAPRIPGAPGAQRVRTTARCQTNPNPRLPRSSRRAGCRMSPHDARSKRTRTRGTAKLRRAGRQPTPHAACSQTNPERRSFSVA